MLFTTLLTFGVAAHAFPAPGNRLPRQEEKAEDPNKLDLTGQFGTAVALQGGNIQQDTTFPAGTNGVLEIEFSNTDGRNLTVTENKNPGSPPAGFVAVEPVSYKVKLRGGSSKNLTLSKVDYILSTGNTLNISQGQIGRLDKNTNTFVVGSSVGELEFEDDENELTLTVANMKGEWGIFLPQAAATAQGFTGTNSSSTRTSKSKASASATAVTKAVDTTGASGSTSSATALLDLLTSLLGSKN